MDVAAKLGIIVDANGARREISLTTDQLKILADGGRDATTVLKGLSGGMTEEGAAAAGATQKTGALTASIANMRAAAARRLDLGLSKQIAELDPFRLRTEAGAVATTKLAASMQRMRDASREKLDLGLASQIQQLDPFQVNLNKVSQAAGGTRLSIGRLGNSIADFAAHMTGVHPIIGKLAEVLGHFAVGGIVTIGVLAGVALLSLAWSKYTEQVRKATEEQNKLVDESLKALRRRALGAGGEFADIATAAAGKISDLQQQRAEMDSFLQRDIRPSVRRENLRQIDSQISQLQLLMKDAQRNVDLARARQFAESITAPFDYAVSRGQSILGFYDNAIVAQRELNDLAKSGDVATKAAALQGLQQIQQVLDQISLQRQGLAERQGTLLGVPAQAAVGGITQTTSNLSAAIDSALKHGRGLADFQDEIQRLYKTVVTAGDEVRRSQMPESVRTAVQSALDQLELLAQAQRMAAAKTAEDRDTIARSIRNLPSLTQSSDAGIFANVEAQRHYGEQLAAREAALKLPPVFDAVREAAVRHGEAERQLTQEIAVSRQAWRDTDAVIANFKEGVLGAVASISQALSPANIAQGVVTSSHQLLSQFFQDAVVTGVDSFRKLFGGVRDMVLKVMSDLASARILSAIGDKLGILTPSVVMDHAATKQVGAAATMLAASNGMVLAANIMARSAGMDPMAGADGRPGAGQLPPVVTEGQQSKGAFGGLGWLRAGGAGVAGGLIGYQIGQSTTNTAYGGLGGAAGGALAGFAVGGPVGAAIGGITGFVGGIIGSGKAAREAARDMKRLQDSLKLTLDSFRAQVRGDTLEQQLISVRQALTTLLKEIDAAYPGTKREARRNQLRAEAEALEAEQERQITAENARQKRQAQEDLKVRLLRAQGRTQEADDLAFANTQQREYADAVKAGADATYLAMLTQVEAAEKVARAIGTLQEAVRNAPTGFHPEDYGIGQTRPAWLGTTGSGGTTGGLTVPTPTPLPLPKVDEVVPNKVIGSRLPISTKPLMTSRAPMPTGFPVAIAATPQAPPTPPAPNVILQFSDGAFVIDGNLTEEQMVRKFVRGIRNMAASVTGPGTPLAQAIEMIQ